MVWARNDGNDAEVAAEPPPAFVQAHRTWRCAQRRPEQLLLRAQAKRLQLELDEVSAESRRIAMAIGVKRRGRAE